jgi:ABC-type hemin transport system ATPase subunit
MRLARSTDATRLLVTSLAVTAMLLVWAAAGEAQTPSTTASSGPGPVTADAGAARDGRSDSGPVDVPAARPKLEKLVRTEANVRALLVEKLDLTVDPATLFDIDISDEPAVRVEVERLRAIVEHAEAAISESGAVELDAGSTTTGVDGGAVDAGGAGDVGAPDAAAGVGAPSEYAQLRALDPELWRARVALDEARLSFYELSASRREALLARHAERLAESASVKEIVEVSDAEKKAAAAEEERLRAIDAAKLARTEATRLVAEEYARLLGVAQQQAQFEVELLKREQALDARREATLALRRRVRELTELTFVGSSEQLVADALYDELRGTLRNGREALDAAMTVLSSGDSAVPLAGENPLLSLPEDIDRAEVDVTRGTVDAAAADLMGRESRARAALAEVLYDQIVALDGDRRALLPLLSPDKRSSVTGFGPTGLSQAFAEARHVSLLLRYDFITATRWVASLTDAEAEHGQSAWAAVILALKWTLPIGVFVWWRRRANATLEGIRERLKEEAKKTRQRPRQSGLAERALDFAIRIRSPVEWLLLVIAVVWLLPPEGQALLEVQLVSTVFYWGTGGAIVVHIVDFLADAEGMRRRRQSKLVTEHLRLRSLRLFGRIIVAFGLILAISERMVGQGTIYVWVFRVCWFAAIPAILVVVRWWRPVIFERVELRKKTSLTRWITDSQEGWKSFAAAIVGGGLLLGTGVYRAVRNRVSTFDVTRRLLAYLFRRGMTKKADRAAEAVHRPIDAKTYRALGPTVASSEIVASEADEQLAGIIARINRAGGGVYAIVGERGSGKTTLLRRIVEKTGEVSLVRCPYGGMDAFAPAFLEALEAEPTATLEDVAQAAEASGENPAVLIDNAHRLILPMMGGLKTFDRIIAIARRSSHRVTWVFAFDEVIWRFFEGMRGSRPLFDDVIRLEPWSEEAIVSLLTSRNEAAAIQPSFAHLQEDLPDDADEIERAEGLAATEASYYRLIWDYAAGNPGVALQVWRNSLGIRPGGDLAVKIFQSPDLRELEALPDTAVFTLRAVVQLESARPDDIARCINIPQSAVDDALRYGLGRGYLREHDGQYEVTWVWFRAVTRFLQRRSLLFGRH